MNRLLPFAAWIAFGLLGFGGTGIAASHAQRSLAIPLDPPASVERMTTTYRCNIEQNGAPADAVADLKKMLPRGNFRVDYINTSDIHLAIVPIMGRTHVLTEVISADGGKYAVDMVTWWTRSHEARFTLESGDARAAMNCTEQP